MNQCQSTLIFINLVKTATSMAVLFFDVRYVAGRLSLKGCEICYKKIRRSFDAYRFLCVQCAVENMREVHKLR